MAGITDILVVSPGEKVFPADEPKVQHVWYRIALGAVLLLSLVMNFYQLGQNGYGNLYYAAGVKSMADSWHNFFFVSFDPGGFVTIDKPPLGFWLQALSTKAFGFTAFSIFFPQAVCGVLAVLLLYVLVRRHFGEIAGLVAALALAVSPISVVTNRNNTIDGTLALALLLAAWAVIRAAETGKLRWLLLSGVFVGLGFNIKMAEAYLVVPALVMTYLLCAPRTVWTRIWHLALFTLVVFALSLSWLLAVDLTPTAQRPYVGSTQNNSELNLAFGYNGLNRLRIGGNGFGGNRGAFVQPATPNTNRAGQNGTAPAGGNAGGPGNQANNFQPQVIFESGAPGLLRLFSASLGGQIAWLLPFALLAILALAWQRRFNFQHDHQQLGLVLWGVWLLTMATFFTLYGSFHQYYMTEMAPGLCALVGIGLVIMWQDYRNKGWRGWLLPLALGVTAAAQLSMLTSYPAWSLWLSPLIAGLTALTIVALVVLRLRPQLNLFRIVAPIATIAISIGMFALLLAPTIWAGYSVILNTESSAPAAGPAAQGGNAGFAFAGRGGTTRRAGNPRGGQNGFAGFFGGSAQTDPALISYLEAHQGAAKFLVATPNANTAAPIILATNKPVMAMGGFLGSDPILTSSDLQTMVSQGTVRFFLINSSGSIQNLIDRLPEQFRNQFFGRGGGFGGFGQNALLSWVSIHCNAVPPSQWQSSGNGGAGFGGNQLYDCASPH